MEYVIKKCVKCGATVQVIKDCTCENCGIKCCGEQMQEVKTNSIECNQEKHLPQVKVVGGDIIVSINHIMEADHYIEWIALVCDDKIGKKFFKPNQEPVAIFPYVKGAKVLAYCNKHGLWETKI